MREIKHFNNIFIFKTVYFQSKVHIEKVNFSPRSVCGEGPHWDVETQSLYYVDIFGTEATMLRYDFNKKKIYSATVDGEPLMTFILPVECAPNHFLVGTKNAGKLIYWNGKSSKGKLIRTVFDVDVGFNSTRFNDAKCDPAGRFFGGTMRLSECDPPFTSPNGSLYQYDPINGERQIQKNILIGNGLTWTSKAKHFFYVDSCTHNILKFDYNIFTGALGKYKKSLIKRSITIYLSKFVYFMCLNFN